jgi:Outer membrane protein and related peptidoglycan-associated (lipo)proteins
MKQNIQQLIKFSLVLSMMALLASCASTPEPDPRVETLQNRLSDLLANPELASRGGEELKRAQSAMKTVQNRPDRMSDQAYEYAIYATDRLIELAKYSAEERYYSDQRKELADEQSRLVLEARTLEAEMAENRAERAKQSAMMAEQQRAQAMAQAQDAQQMRDAAMQAKAEAEAARAEAERLKAQAQEAAESAMSEAEKAKARAEAEAARAEAAQAEAAAAKAAMNSLQNQLSELQAKQTERGLVITLGDVLFAFNKSDLKPGAARNLEPLVKALNDNPNQQVIVEGHTDNVGSKEYNLKLSEQRAESVKGYLTDNGIDADRIDTEGLGFEFPVASNDDASGRQRNRRVEIILPDIEPQDIEEE